MRLALFLWELGVLLVLLLQLSELLKTVFLHLSSDFCLASLLVGLLFSAELLVVDASLKRGLFTTLQDNNDLGSAASFDQRFPEVNFETLRQGGPVSIHNLGFFRLNNRLKQLNVVLLDVINELSRILVDLRVGRERVPKLALLIGLRLLEATGQTARSLPLGLLSVHKSKELIFELETTNLVLLAQILNLG